MRIDNIKRYPNPPIICQFDVFFEEQGYGLREFRLMETNGVRWIAFPCRPYKDDAGKPRYVPVMYFREEKKLELQKLIFTALADHIEAPSIPTHPKTRHEETAPF